MKQDPLDPLTFEFMDTLLDDYAKQELSKGIGPWERRSFAIGKKTGSETVIPTRMPATRFRPICRGSFIERAGSGTVLRTVSKNGVRDRYSHQDAGYLLPSHSSRRIH